MSDIRTLDAMVHAGDAIRGGIHRFESRLDQLEHAHLRALADRLDISSEGRRSRDIRAAIRFRLLGVKGVAR
jgi:predicted component of type VI protein secretion system